MSEEGPETVSVVNTEPLAVLRGMMRSELSTRYIWAVKAALHLYIIESLLSKYSFEFEKKCVFSFFGFGL